MKVIILNEAGSVDNLKYVDSPKPEIKEDEVLVKVASLSVNPVDYKVRANDAGLSMFFGSERPVILGWDLSGTIEKIGSKVTNFKIGDEVFGMANFPGNGSAYAEYVAVSFSHLTLKPTSISHQAAAAATLAALTAWQVLNGNVKQGDKVLIHAASGGVGHYATQIAKYLGAFVIGTSSTKNRDFVLQNGADRHIDYTQEDFEKVVSDVDVVLDTLNSDIIDKSINITRTGGKIITITSNNIPQEILDKAKSKGIDLSFVLVKSSGKDMSIIADLLDKGTLKSHVSKSFSFGEMSKAHLQLETGRTVGKVVVNLEQIQ